jgi:ApbE superfamily uncharacterized protein (UPF0280 family)
VLIGDWLVTDPGFQFEAPLMVMREALPEVLRRLAMASAQTYYDRLAAPVCAPAGRYGAPPRR